MAYQKAWYFNVDIKKQKDQDIITMVNQDLYGNVLYIRLMDRGKPVDLSSVDYINVISNKPDGTYVVGSATIVDAEKGKIKYEVDSQVLTVIGLVGMSFQLFSSGVRVTSTDLYVDIIEDPYQGSDEDLESQTDYPLLQNLMNDLSDLEDTTNSKISAMDSKLIEIDSEWTDKKLVYDDKVNKTVERAKVADTYIDGIDSLVDLFIGRYGYNLIDCGDFNDTGAGTTIDCGSFGDVIDGTTYNLGDFQINLDESLFINGGEF